MSSSDRLQASQVYGVARNPSTRVDSYTLIRKGLGWLATFLIVFFAGVTVYEAGPYRTGNINWGSPYHRTDYTVYYEAGKAVLQGTDIYSVRSIRGWAYVYPPPFSIAMVPLSLLPLPLSVLCFYAICAGMMVSAIVMAARLAQPRPSTPQTSLEMLALPILLTFAWFGHGLARGQASVIMTWMVTAGVYWERRGKLLAGAAALAGGIMIKIFPLSLLAYFAWRRRWRFVAATLALAALGTFVLPIAVFGWRGNINYLHEFKQTVMDPATMSESGRSHYDLYDQLLSLGKPRNQALAPVLYRFFGGEQTPAITVTIAIALIALIWLLTRTAGADAENLILGASLIAMLLMSPVAEDHYYSMMLLPAACAVAAVLSSQHSLRKTVGIVGLSAFGALNFSGLFGHRFEYYGVVCWAAVLLLALTLYLIRSSGAGPEANSTSGAA